MQNQYYFIITNLVYYHPSQTDLPVPFTRDVQDFVKGLFLSGQTELAVQQNESGEKSEINKKIPAVNPYRINVQANAACINLLVWASTDESGKFVASFIFSLSLVLFHTVFYITKKMQALNLL